MSECIFCDIAEGKVDTRKVYEDDDILAFRDLNPQAPTHILIIPKKHIPKLTETSKEDVILLGKMQLAIPKIAAKTGMVDFRVVINNGRGAGQTVDHLHFHLLGGRRMMWPPG